MKKITAIALLLVLLLSVFTGCSGNSGIVGEWYDSKGHCLDIRKDGSFKLDGEYGTGKWKKLDNTNYEFYDFYGQVYEAELKGNSNGAFLDIEWYGDFYKGSYPDDDNNNNNSNSNEKDNYQEVTTTEAPSITTLDAFSGLKIEASGISPYCQVAINDSGCDSEVQMNVTYSLDKEYYANGDKVIVTATLNSAADNYYSLIETEYSYDLPERPEYITSVEDIDFSLLISEREDTVKASIASAIGNKGLFGISAYDFNKLSVNNIFTAINSTNIKAEYFTSLKPIKYDTFNVSTNVFNSIHFIYEISASWEDPYASEAHHGTNNMYTNFIAYNVVKYPNGDISWGVDNPEAYDFKYETTFNGVDDCITTKIMCYSDDYNIEKVDIEKEIDN